MIKTRTDEEPIGCKYPVATGSMLFSSVPNFNSDFLKAGVLHDIEENPESSNISVEDFRKHCLFLDVHNSAASLELITQTYDVYDDEDEDEVPRMSGCPEDSDVQMVFNEEKGTIVNKSNMFIPIADFLIPMPEWADYHIQFLSGHSGDFQLVFYIEGEKDYDSDFAATVEQWWRRMMTAFTPRLAVCTVDDGGNSCILTEKDVDDKFMEIIGDRTSDKMWDELPKEYRRVKVLPDGVEVMYAPRGEVL